MTTIFAAFDANYRWLWCNRIEQDVSFTQNTQGDHAELNHRK